MLLTLNVMPGMAFVAIGIPWLMSDGRDSAEASLLFCAAVPMLSVGQVVVGAAALRFGDKIVFCAMFALRMSVFAAAYLVPSVAHPWPLLALAFFCHGGGFGLIPRMVMLGGKITDRRLLGLVLSGWGVGGALSVLAVSMFPARPWIGDGLPILAIFMALGLVFTARAEIKAA